MAEIITIPSRGDTIDGQFELGRELGRGGYGIVFEARQLGVERKVAVKMLLPRAMEHQRDVVERFAREARLASSLKHRNAVTIYAFGVYKDDSGKQGLPYIAMEYLEGYSLQDYITKVGTLPVAEVGEILQDILLVLDEAHQKGIIHRDLKPANIFFHEPAGEERVVKVLDFGIAMAVSPDWSEENRQRLTETGLVTGTAEYMAPEQALGSQEFTAAIDVYALGCLGYQMLTGRFPFSGSNPVEIAIKHIYEPIPDLPEPFRSTVVGQVILKALHKDPSVRFANAMVMLGALRTGETGTFDLTGGTAPSRHPLAPPPTTGELAAAGQQPTDVVAEAGGGSMRRTVAIVAIVSVLVTVAVVAMTAFSDVDGDTPTAPIAGQLGSGPEAAEDPTPTDPVVADGVLGGDEAAGAPTGGDSDDGPTGADEEQPAGAEDGPGAEDGSGGGQGAAGRPTDDASGGQGAAGRPTDDASGGRAAPRTPEPTAGKEPSGKAAPPGKTATPTKTNTPGNSDGPTNTDSPNTGAAAKAQAPADAQAPKADGSTLGKADADGAGGDKGTPGAKGGDAPEKPADKDGDASAKKPEGKDADEGTAANTKKKDPPVATPPKDKKKESEEVPHGF